MGVRVGVGGWVGWVGGVILQVPKIHSSLFFWMFEFEVSGSQLTLSICCGLLVRE